MQPMKKCWRCKKQLPISHFSPSRTNKKKLSGWCDPCREKPVERTKYYYYSCYICGKGRHMARQPRKTAWLCWPCKWSRYKGMQKARNNDPQIKKRLIRERGQQCELCGKRGKVVMHHITEIVNGGKSTDDNLQLVCKSCHDGIHTNRRWGIPL